MRHRKVLVADDEPATLELVSEALERPDVDVFRAADGVELIERLAEHGPFDLVVTDISMPWMTGLQAAHTARTAGVRTPMIVITALKDPRLEEQVATLGECAILLRKPFGLAELESAVASLLPP
jgi:CheY-like chemotaxis protein